MRYLYYYDDEICRVPGYSEADGEWLTAVKANPAQIAFYIDGATYYIPARASKSTETLVYTSPTSKYYFTNDDRESFGYTSKLAFRKNGTLYYCGELYRKLVSGIPAGTYTPSVFESLIKKYISVNSYRKVSAAFSVKVNNQEVTVAAGKPVYYMDNASSGAAYYSTAVNFSGSYMTLGSCFNILTSHPSNGFLSNKVYIVSSKIPYFSRYADYNITLLNDIIFT